MHPKQLSIHDYSYFLPEERIAKYPLAERDHSKLLIYQNHSISQDTYRNLAGHLDPASLLVFNDTKVVQARIHFQKPTGAAIEVFCLEPHVHYRDIAQAISQKKSVVWMCLIGGASKWKHGQILEKIIDHGKQSILLRAKYLEKIKDSFAIELSWTPEDLSFADVLHAGGLIPLPPYIKRLPETSDAERYQTIYAQTEGSVAAPTAGLHFTNKVFEQLRERKIEHDFVTLHVGAGTFKPVKGETMVEHDMHGEFIDVSRATIEHILQFAGKPVTAIGTTSLRAIESLYWLGLKTIRDPAINPLGFSLHQWEPYEMNTQNISVPEAFQSLLTWVQSNQAERLVAKTQLLIAPGYAFKIVNTLVTNFHQPQSTLLLLVAAFIGNDWKKVYEYALRNDFRFLSYGDGCLLFRQ